MHEYFQRKFERSKILLCKIENFTNLDERFSSKCASEMENISRNQYILDLKFQTH